MPCLYIVATPIGNRDDISLRALHILQTVDAIAAEDTRHSQRLLQYHGINTPLFSLHEHNEVQRVQYLLDRFAQGEHIAMISDAGTPLISDPGYRLITALKEARIQVVPIPGACAAIAGLISSGLPTDRFVFEGFLPAKRSARLKRLKVLIQEERTLIFYESTHRIVESLSDMGQVFGGDRLAAVARELTKAFETIERRPLSELLAWMEADSYQQKGEFVLIVQGLDVSTAQESTEEQRRLLTILMKEMPLKQAVAIASQFCEAGRKTLYALALDIKNH